MLKKILKVLSKLSCYSKCCCGSECMLNPKDNISDNNIDNEFSKTN